jgi:hypothetical protein
MRKEKARKQYSRLCRSKRAMAIPVTFFMLFVSLMLIITATYYVAMTRISAQGKVFNFSAAKQSMIALEKNIETVLWSPGASQVYYVDDFGGNLKIMPTAKILLLNLTDNNFSDVILNSAHAILNSPVGEVFYELSHAEPGSSGLFLEGDARVIVNSSSATMSQLQLSTGETTQEIRLTYRPLASSMVTGSSGGKPVNTVRIYVINMNLSQGLSLSGGFYLKATCVSVTSITRSYNINSTISSIQVKTVFDGVNGTVSLPISSNVSGSFVNVELMACNVQLQRVEV